MTFEIETAESIETLKALWGWRSPFFEATRRIKRIHFNIVKPPANTVKRRPVRITSATGARLLAAVERQWPTK